MQRRVAEAVIDTFQTPIMVLDDRSRVVFANRMFFHFFGASPGRTIGAHLRDIDWQHLDVDSLSAVVARLKKQPQGSGSCEVAARSASAGWRTLVVSAEPVHGSGDADKLSLISFDDVTNSRRVERKLDGARQAAELANATKSRFLAAASHDLRQPVQTLALLHASLRREIDSRAGLALIARAERTLDVMAGILTKLLDINQLDRGTVHPKVVEFSIGDVLTALEVEYLEPMRNKSLRWRIVKSHQIVRSDPRLLEEIMRNLLSNAVRYTDRGKVLLGCRSAGDNLRIEVWDTGIGIPEQDIPRIFREYQQASGGAMRGGLGLGLAIVRFLADLLGLVVRARSQVGRGSVFSIEVPLATGARQPIESAGDMSAKHPHRTGTILILEDDASVREALQLMLEREGHRVVSAATREALLDLLVTARVRPDLVISDHDLSGVAKGTDVAEALRERHAFLAPIIILTGDNRNSTWKSIEASGCIGLCKPVKAEELSSTIQGLLAIPRVEEKAATLSPAVETADSEASAASKVSAPGEVSTAGEVGAASELDPMIFVVDDDQNTREAMRTFLVSAGRRVKTYASGHTFLQAYAGEKGCLLVDIRMPTMNGFELIAQLMAAGQHIPTIMITGQGDIGTAVRAVKAGAADFIEKPVNPVMLLASIDRVLREAATPMQQAASGSAAAWRLAGLTKREREVMELVVGGNANKEIAYRLGISQRTVETHRAAVMKKMGASSLSQLVRLDISAHAGGSRIERD
jgi:two-component system, chemotaxis family, CheB/CheR fusion protein